MIIKGIDYGFCMTTEAAIKIAKLCPNGNIKNFGQLLEEDDYEKAVNNLATIMDVLNEGYVSMEMYENGRQAPRIEREELLDAIKHSTLYRYNEINTEIVMTIIRDLTGEVEAEEAPGKPEKKEETGAIA